MDIDAIDGHRHVLLEEAIAAGSKLNLVKSSHLYPSGLNEWLEQINRGKKGDRDRKRSERIHNDFLLQSRGGWLMKNHMFFHMKLPSSYRVNLEVFHEDTPLPRCTGHGTDAGG